MAFLEFKNVSIVGMAAGGLLGFLVVNILRALLG